MNPYLDNRCCDIKCELKLIDLTAQEDATPEAMSNAEISNINQTIDDIREQTIKIATLELNEWMLDGSMEFYDSQEKAQYGWWSEELSDKDGNINTEISFKFTEAHSSFGLTLFFDEQNEIWATEYTIIAFDENENEIIRQEIKKTGAKQAVIIQIENYYRITINFTKTNVPNRRIRLTEIVFGIIESFDRFNTKTLKVNKEFDINSDSLPINEVEIIFDNSNQRYNMVSPDGAYKYMQVGMPFTVELGIGEDFKNLSFEEMGSFYYLSSESEDGALTAKITAGDAIMYLDKVSFTKQITAPTLRILAAEITEQVGQRLTFVLDDEIADIPLFDILDESEITCRDVLRQACQALSAICYTNKKNEIIVKRASLKTANDYLTKNEMLTVPKIKTGERINTVIIENGEIQGISQQLELNEVVQILKKTNMFVTQDLANNVAEWLLSNTKLFKFEIDARGNPLRELSDTIAITDAFGTVREAILTKHVIKYDGGISEELEAVGKVE